MSTLRSITVLAVVVSLVAGCSASTLSPSPAGPTSTPTAATVPPPVSPSPTVRVIETPAPATPAPSPVKAHWEQAGTMHVARTGLHAQLMGDGRVLVVGSGGSGEYVYPVDWDLPGAESRVTELWSQATNDWHRAQPLPKARGGFAAETLRDGRVLVAGGVSPERKSYSSAYVFDPASEAWEKVGLMDTARIGPASAVLADGRVLLAGGRYSEGYPEGIVVDAVLAVYRPALPGDGAGTEPPLDDIDPGPLGRALATAELFNPKTGSWSRTGSMRFARSYPNAVTLGDGRVLVWGGSEGTPETGELYDPSTGRFSAAPALPEVDDSVLEDLRVRAPEGSPSQWGYRSLVALADGDAMLVNALWEWSDDDSAYFITRSYRFDHGRDRWRAVGDPFVTTAYDDSEDGQDWGVRHPSGIVVALPDGRVLFAGGTRAPRRAELLDPDTGTWSALPKLPEGRERGEGVVLEDGSVVVIGEDGFTDTFRFVPAQ